MSKKMTVTLTFTLLLGCGTKNLFDCHGGLAQSQCTQYTQDQKAHQALDALDYTTAITILAQEIQTDPGTYHRYPVLAAAYAGRSGFDILNIATANFGGSSSLLQLMSSFVPTPVSRGALYAQSLIDMNAAVTTLATIPADQRQSTSSDIYASSASLQYTLYQGAYGIMLLNKFTYSTTGFDPSQLANMTADDALAIISALAGAAAGTGQAGQAVNAAVTAIQAEPGATTQAKLSTWVQANQTSGQSKTSQ